MLKKKYKFIHQLHQMDCGRACLKMIALHYGYDKSKEVDQFLELSPTGNSFYEISIAAEKIGIISKAVKLPIQELQKLDYPCILHWENNHYVVLFSINKKQAVIGNPASKIETISIDELTKHWGAVNSGFALLLLPNAHFFDSVDNENSNIIIKNIVNYLGRFKSLFFQLFLGFIVGSLIQLLLPFLMQNIIDKGIMLNNLAFVKVILFSQLALLIGRIAIEYIRSWILMHISIRLNIFILTDFFAKVFNLPIRYFESTTKGDFLQRLDDQKRIEVFFTDQTINIFFSLLNLIIYSGVIIYYDITIFWLFIGFSILYGLWVYVFLPRRKELDKMRFRIGAELQTSTIQLIDGMKDIKMYNVEKQKRWAWEDLRAEMFSFNIKSLTLNQWQQGGATLINESKNIVITFLCAKLAVEGNITLGVMMSIQYILGQLNNPIQQFIGFVQSYQDAKLSINRLNEMYDTEDEVKADKKYYPVPINFSSISFNDVSVKINSIEVLKNINLSIEKGKITAIVGESGGGKTSLLKLMIGSLKPSKGEILIGDIDLQSINIHDWRRQVGAIMQDGFIFADSIIDNVCLSNENKDYEKFKQAIKLAKLEEYIHNLPEKENFQLAYNGSNLSQGQKQRMLLARVLYKDPNLLILDEATNALDSKTEEIILENLKAVTQHKTVIVVAHRLNTIRSADKILVIEKGELVASGNHDELLANSSIYADLVKKQLSQDGK